MTAFSSIRTKFALAILLVGAGLTAFLVAYFPAVQGRHLWRDLQEKSLMLHRIAGLQVRSAVAFNDVETPREAFEALGVDPDVTRLALYGPDRRLLYGTAGSPPRAPELVKGAQMLPEGVRVVGEVVSDEGPRGVLLVELSAVRVMAELEELRWVAVSGGLLSLLLAMIAAWWVASSVAGRITRVANAVTNTVERVAAGDLSGAAIEDKRRDEIGRLAAACNGMVEALQRLAARVATTSEDITGASDALLSLVDDSDANAGLRSAVSELQHYAKELGGVARDWRSTSSAENAQVTEGVEP